MSHRDFFFMTCFIYANDIHPKAKWLHRLSFQCLSKAPWHGLNSSDSYTNLNWIQLCILGNFHSFFFPLSFHCSSSSMERCCSRATHSAIGYRRNLIALRQLVFPGRTALNLCPPIALSFSSTWNQFSLMCLCPKTLVKIAWPFTFVIMRTANSCSHMNINMTLGRCPKDTKLHTQGPAFSIAQATVCNWLGWADNFKS